MLSDCRETHQDRQTECESTKKPWYVSCSHCGRHHFWLIIIYMFISFFIVQAIGRTLPESTDLLMMARGRTPCISYELRTNQNPKPLIPVSCDYTWGFDAAQESENYEAWRKINPDLPAMDVYPLPR